MINAVLLKALQIVEAGRVRVHPEPHELLVEQEVIEELLRERFIEKRASFYALTPAGEQFIKRSLNEAIENQRLLSMFAGAALSGLLPRCKWLSEGDRIQVVDEAWEIAALMQQRRPK